MIAGGWNTERSYLAGWLDAQLETPREVAAERPEADVDAFLNGADDRRVCDSFRIERLLQERGLVARTYAQVDDHARRILASYQEGTR